MERGGGWSDEGEDGGEADAYPPRAAAGEEGGGEGRAGVRRGNARKGAKGAAKGRRAGRKRTAAEGGGGENEPLRGANDPPRDDAPKKRATLAPDRIPHTKLPRKKFAQATLAFGF